jgi:DNA-binding LytR/AlgR family response regulator
MEWLRISTSTELVRVATDEIVYVRADGNYSDLVLTNGRSRKMTFQIHFFDEVFQQLRKNMFVRVGRSLIVNKRYIYVINLTEQMILFAGQPIKGDIAPVKVSREALRLLKEQLENEKGGDYE